MNKTKLDQIVTILLGMFCVIGSYYFYIITLDHQKATNATASEAVKTANQSLAGVNEVKQDTAQASASALAAQSAALAARDAADRIAHERFIKENPSAKVDTLEKRVRSLERLTATQQDQIKRLQGK